MEERYADGQVATEMEKGNDCAVSTREHMT